MKFLKKHLRKIVQVGWGFITNAHLSGFVTGKLYTGPLKKVCVPGMNCYSCPGALGACPIGSLQSSFTGRKPKFPFYVLGFLCTIGLFVGRFICGWLCLFGLIEELLYMIPTPKIKVPAKLDKALRYLKYVLLAVFVILLPIALRDKFNMSAPYFCKYICPVGMLEGGVILPLFDAKLRSAAHFLYAGKFVILAVVIVMSVFIHRPFCKYMCPLGAFYALFNRISLLNIVYDQSSCVNCGACQKTCKMQVDPTKQPNSAECIRCGECVKSCPAGSLKFRFGLGSRKTTR